MELKDIAMQMDEENIQVTTAAEFIKNLDISDQDRKILMICIEGAIDMAVQEFAKSLIAMFTEEDPKSAEYNNSYNKDYYPLVKHFVYDISNIICKQIFGEDGESNE